MAVTWGIVLFVMIVCAVYKAVGASCTSFTYNRGSAWQFGRQYLSNMQLKEPDGKSSTPQE